MSKAYYNEHDPFAAAWLRELIKAGAIAPGDVDQRDIRDVHPQDLDGYTQCHFFAGIGVWSYALRQAGVPDDYPVWTGSCPCQPFSAAGRGAGFTDERHLWPHWFHLISQRRPKLIFGEQVDAGVRWGWLDLVQADLAGENYTSGSVVFPAGGLGAPHRRQRLYFVAHAPRIGRGEGHPQSRGGNEGIDAGKKPQRFLSSPSGRMAHAPSGGLHGRGASETSDDGGQWGETSKRRTSRAQAQGLRHDNRMADPTGIGQPQSEQQPTGSGETHRTGQGHGSRSCPSDFRDVANAEGSGRGICDPTHIRATDAPLHPSANANDGPDGEPPTSPLNNFWRDSDWLLCRDGKWRAVEPGTFPLAYGLTQRVGRLRGYGNAIVAPAASAFIRAAIASIEES